MRIFRRNNRAVTAAFAHCLQPVGTRILRNIHIGVPFPSVSYTHLFLRREIEVIGAGRTDAGVHASLMVAHFDYDGPLDTVSVADKLNRLLPPDTVSYTHL